MKAKTTKVVNQTASTDQAAEVSEVINPDAGYTVLIDKGVASKLSPKSAGAVFFQLVLPTMQN
jgi:hypothetical protein